MPDNKNSEFPVEKTIGVGAHIVYVYYYENDKALALANGRDRWECKIGFTRRQLDKRLIEQGISASLARHPIVPLQILSDHAHVLETRIHRKLSAYKVPHGIGDEWYLTNPDEVEKVYLELLPSMEKLAELLDTFSNNNEVFQTDSSGDLGDALRSIRNHKGLTQGEVGIRSGMRQASVSRLENGAGNARIDSLLKVLDACGYHLLIVKE